MSLALEIEIERVKAKIKVKTRAKTGVSPMFPSRNTLKIANILKK